MSIYLCRGFCFEKAFAIEEVMVVFSLVYRCDDVWELNLITMTWRLVDIGGIRPRPRFGHSQIVLDDNNLLIIGGCAGPNMV